MEIQLLCFNVGKGWPGDTNQSFLSKADADPGSLGKLMTWLDASEVKNLTITEWNFSLAKQWKRYCSLA